MFADEHMVEMNRRPSIHAPRQRRRSRSMSPAPSPRSPKLLPPTPASPSQSEQTPSTNETLNHDPLLVISGRTENQLEQTDDNNHKSDKTPRDGLQGVSKGDSLKKTPNDIAVGKNAKPLPFRSSSLPEDQVNNAPVKTLVDKVQQISRKRERTPSPTYTAPLPNSKRPAFSNSVSVTNSSLGTTGTPKFTSSSLPSGTKQGSKVSVSGLKSSLASKVLTEEIQKQQGQENSKLKVLIVKEVRKPGKSESKFAFVLSRVPSMSVVYYIGSKIIMTLSRYQILDFRIVLVTSEKRTDNLSIALNVFSVERVHCIIIAYYADRFAIRH